LFSRPAVRKWLDRITGVVLLALCIRLARADAAFLG